MYVMAIQLPLGSTQGNVLLCGTGDVGLEHDLNGPGLRTESERAERAADACIHKNGDTRDETVTASWLSH